jgi:hypothetical protein
MKRNFIRRSDSVPEYYLIDGHFLYCKYKNIMFRLSHSLFDCQWIRSEYNFNYLSNCHNAKKLTQEEALKRKPEIFSKYILQKPIIYS